MIQDKKKFIKLGLLFVATALVVLFLTNLYFIKNVENQKLNYRIEAQFQDFVAQNEEINYIFFGDSHASEAINPKYIPKSFNYAMGGEEYRETYFKVRKVINENIKVNAIVLEIDPHTFSPEIRTKETLFQNIYYYSKFTSTAEISKLKEENIAQIYIRQNLVVLGKGRELANFILSEPGVRPIYLGWLETHGDYSNLTTEERTTSAKAKVESHFGNQEKLIEEESLEYFIKTIKLAKENNIEIIFIMYPMSIEFQNAYLTKGINRDNYYNTLFKEIENAIGKDYEILNYYNLFPNSPEYYSNSDHVHDLGSEILSKQVDKDLKSIS